MARNHEERSATSETSEWWWRRNSAEPSWIWKWPLMSSLEVNYRVSNVYITAWLPSFLANPPCLLLSARLLAMHCRPAGLGPNFRESFILALSRSRHCTISAVAAAAALAAQHDELGHMCQHTRTDMRSNTWGSSGWARTALEINGQLLLWGWSFDQTEPRLMEYGMASRQRRKPWMTLIAPSDTPSVVYPNTAVSTLKEELTLVDRGQHQEIGLKKIRLDKVLKYTKYP